MELYEVLRGVVGEEETERLLFGSYDEDED